MADAARLAHPAGASLCAIAVAVGLALGPARVRAEPAPSRDAAATTAEPDDATPADDAEDVTSPGPADPADDAGDAGPGADAEVDDEAEAHEAEAHEAEADETEVDDGEAEADQAEADETEDEADDDVPAAAGPTAEPLRPLQTAAWWTMFGAFAVGTTAGVLAGLAERQEDRATRLSTLFDAQTGAQPLYADRQDEYEQYLRRGEGYAKAAIGVGVVAGVATIAAITLFAIDARRQRTEKTSGLARERRRAALRVHGGGVEVRF